MLIHRDKLVAKGKAAELSAAVVFLPEHTLDYGRHGSDKCYCEEMYGEVKPWGCKWFENWRQHVEKAVAKKQKLQVFYAEGRVGQGQSERLAVCVLALIPLVLQARSTGGQHAKTKPCTEPRSGKLSRHSYRLCLRLR